MGTLKSYLFSNFREYLSVFTKRNGGRLHFGDRLVVSTPRFAEARFAEENPDSANAKPRLPGGVCKSTDRKGDAAHNPSDGDWFGWR